MDKLAAIKRRKEEEEELRQQVQFVLDAITLKVNRPLISARVQPVRRTTRRKLTEA